MDESGFLSKLDSAVSLTAMTLSAMTSSTATLLGRLPSWMRLIQRTVSVRSPIGFHERLRIGLFRKKKSNFLRDNFQKLNSSQST